jgi:glutamyl-Q tRNA(Asp) synthetase
MRSIRTRSLRCFGIGAVVTRFAPSPTGYLHLGHAFSALTAFRFAQQSGGRFLLRIEDIDPERCRPEYETAIYEDLAWLGLRWEMPVRRQSEHVNEYASVLEQLKALDVAYPCFCSRKQVAVLSRVIGEGENEPLYPGVCRQLSGSAAGDRIARGELPCWRLDAKKAAAITGPLSWWDRTVGKVSVQPEEYGDVVIARRDVSTSYHLSVTLDDHVQGITHVVRGQDLFGVTGIHRTLQALLGFGVPEYFHHQLLLDARTGRKLSKRDRSTSLRSLRVKGVRPEELMRSLETKSPAGGLPLSRSFI